MMDFVGLQSSFFLCVILAFSEQESVVGGCTSSMFLAVVEPTLLGQDYFLHSDEVSLGTSCLVTDITEKRYVFNYPVTESRIQKELIIFGYRSKHYQNNLTKFRNDHPSANTYSPWNVTHTCLFGLLWIPHFQDTLVESCSQSLLLNMPQPLVHESANMTIF